MNWYEIDVEPRDVLFFRDARPMDGAHIGRGGAWPLPSVWHQALLTAFHDRWPEPQPWERVAPVDRHPRAGSGRFGALATVGLFPRMEKELLVPTPADIGPQNVVAKLVRLAGSGNLPQPLTLTPAFFAPASKGRPGDWMRLSELTKYLKGETDFKLVRREDLFDSELRPGIAINPASGATEEGKFYMAEYLRLKPHSAMTGFARCVEKNTNREKDVLAEWLSGGPARIVLGGQAGVACLNCRRDKVSRLPLALESAPAGARVKWVLLTPACFNAGWRPAWVNAASGKVRLKAGDTTRRAGEDRKTWRQRIEKMPEIHATLVAACLSGPQYVSGWNLTNACHDAEPVEKREHKPGPKPTVALVPAGSVFYFEAAEETAAIALQQALVGIPRSDRWGERGFGLGVCGSWEMGL